jgi:hypothetical protein
MTSHSNYPETGSPRSLRETMRLTRDLIQATSRKPSSTGSPTGEGSARNELLPVGKSVSASGATPMPTERGPLAAFDLPAQAATLAHSLAPLLVWGEASIIGDHGFEGVNLTGVRVRDGADARQVDLCLGGILEICDPCDPQLAARKLAELRVLTAHRARDGVDVELMAGAYTERLAAYPADIVVAAVDGWANREEFWPTWAELKAECDKRMRGRKLIRQALVEWRPAAARPSI